jgi:hypothetical protein
MADNEKFPNVRPFGSSPIVPTTKIDPEEDYQRRLIEFKQAGRGAGFGFKPRTEDTEAALAARDAYLKKREQEDAASNVQSRKKGGIVSASKRADGIAQRGKTRGKIC